MRSPEPPASLICHRRLTRATPSRIALPIGLAGYDECFGNGRIDALRAVLHDTSATYDATAPFCPEYQE